MRIRIITRNSANGRREDVDIVDADTGEHIPNVQSVTFHASVNSLARAVVEFVNVETDIVADAVVAEKAKPVRGWLARFFDGFLKPWWAT